MRLSRIRDEYSVKADVYIEPSDRWMTSVPVVESRRSGGGTLTGAAFSLRAEPLWAENIYVQSRHRRTCASWRP